MKIPFSKNKILQLSISPYDNYCIGYSGKGGYITTLIMTISSFKERFSAPGSKILDSIIAYDRTEVADTYIGQINMEIVSSFIGPQGLIWGYDLAKSEDLKIHSLLNKEILEKFKGTKIKNGENLRRAGKMLFGTRDKRHFPLLPGDHVPCAGKFYFEKGPTYLYAAAAIGIPENRGKSACLLIEDVGRLKKITFQIKQKVISNIIQSVLEIGKNHKINYREIFVDFIAKKIHPKEIGCALIAVPYFHLAKKAYKKNLAQQTLKEWIKETEKDFLIN